MFQLHKFYVFDENQQPIAVQIPIAEFEQLEEMLENYGLVQLMEAAPEEDDDHVRLSKTEALEYYRSLQDNHVES